MLLREAVKITKEVMPLREAVPLRKAVIYHQGGDAAEGSSTAEGSGDAEGSDAAREARLLLPRQLGGRVISAKEARDTGGVYFLKFITGGIMLN
jgi:hypothetical protein